MNDGDKKLDVIQKSWLIEELEESKNYCNLRLIFMHIPLFDPRPEHEHCLSASIASNLLTLFQKYRVSYIFYGHVHGYFSGYWKDIPYVISGGSGARLYGNDKKHFFYHYVKITINNGKILQEIKALKYEQNFFDIVHYVLSNALVFLKYYSFYVFCLLLFLVLIFA